MNTPELRPPQLFPHEIVTTPKDGADQPVLHLDAAQGMHVDRTYADAFRKIDEDYVTHRDLVIDELFDTVDSFHRKGTYRQDSKIHTSLHSSDDEHESNMLVVVSQFNDGRPTSNPQAVKAYLDSEKPSRSEVSRAKRNSINPAVKLSIGAHLIRNLGYHMPVAALWSPVPPRAMTLQERRQLAGGDYSAYGALVLDMVNGINDERSRLGKQPIKRLHLFGAGMPQRAIGAAAYLNDDKNTHRDLKVSSVSAVNLSLGRGLATVGDHVGQRSTSDDSRIVIPRRFVNIPEPQLRQDLETRPQDTIQAMARQGHAVTQLLATTFPQMFKHQPTVDAMQTILDQRTSLHVSNALNTSMAQKTAEYLPVGDPLFKYTSIVAPEGKKVTMMANEHAALIAVAMTLGIRDAAERGL